MFNFAVVRFNCDPMRTDLLANLIVLHLNEKFLTFLGQARLVLNLKK